MGAIAGIEPGNTGGGSVSTQPIAHEVFLGQFTIIEGVSQPTFFTLGALDPISGGNTSTYDHLFDLDTAADQFGFPTNQFTGVGSNVTTFVVGLPEPGALSVLACCGGFLCVRRRRVD